MVPRLVVSIVCAAAGMIAGCGAPTATSDPADAPGPHDAAVAIDASCMTTMPPVEMPPGIPDLQFIDDRMVNSVLVTTNDFGGDTCEVMEGCVGAEGRRTLLRFDTVTANRGTGNLAVGVPPPAGCSNATFQWSPCHMHHHVMSYTSYELVNSTGTVVTARKQSFCLEDAEIAQPGSPRTGYSCMNQGISRGWADSYGRSTACQWIDVTGVAPGAYTLRVVVNPQQTLPESDYTNNVFTVGVQL